MNKQPMILAIVTWLAGVSAACALDQIKTSTQEKILLGKITGVTATVINFEPSGKSGGPTEIPVNEIVRIMFENEPNNLFEARKRIHDGDYADALTSLEKINPDETARREVAEEVEFSKAFCSAQMALAGNASPSEAAKQMLGFISNSPNSYHYLQACELMGNLAVAAGAYAKAEEYYAKLAKAPWPDYKMRAQIAMARALLAQGKAAEANKAFDEALLNDAGGELAEGQRIAAKIGKARCMALTGKADLAVRTVEEIVAKIEGDNVELHALAYNALGTALRKSGKPDKAVLAFLHVHLLYSSLPEAHAEALANLEQLFTETHKPVHAQEMRQILDDRYRDSRWAKGLR